MFVAAYWNRRSASAEILRACQEGRVRPYYTQQMRNEIFLILRNIKAPEHYKQVVNDILETGMELTAPGKLSVVAEDPEDDKFLECAQLARADYLITNDDHLLRLGNFDGTRIVKPPKFMRILHGAP